MVTVVTLNNDGKIEFTKEELTKLLEQAHDEGYQEGMAAVSRPYLTTTNDWWNKQPTVTYCNNEAQTTLL